MVKMKCPYCKTNQAEKLDKVGIVVQYYCQECKRTFDRIERDVKIKSEID